MINENLHGPSVTSLLNYTRCQGRRSTKKPEKVPKHPNIPRHAAHSFTQRRLEDQLTLFGLAGALSEQQLVLFIGERLWKDSGHQRTEETQHTDHQSMWFFGFLDDATSASCCVFTSWCGTAPALPGRKSRWTAGG